MKAELCIRKDILDQCWPRLTTSAVAAVNVAGAGGNCPTVGGREGRGRCACRQREKKNTKEEISGCGERAEDAEDRVGVDRPTVEQ